MSRMAKGFLNSRVPRTFCELPVPISCSTKREWELKTSLVNVDMIPLWSNDMFSASIFDWDGRRRRQQGYQMKVFSFLTYRLMDDSWIVCVKISLSQAVSAENFPICLKKMQELTEELKKKYSRQTCLMQERGYLLAPFLDYVTPMTKIWDSQFSKTEKTNKQCFQVCCFLALMRRFANRFRAVP